MLRIGLGIVVGFVAWVFVWVGNEQILSAIFPNWFGAQQSAFTAAISDGGEFQPQTGFLITHVVCGAIVSALAGFLAALIAGEQRRAPVVLGGLLTGLGLLKLVMSWQYVPLWYHLVFTGMLFPLTMLGGRMRIPLLYKPGDTP